MTNYFKVVYPRDTEGVRQYEVFPFSDNRGVAKAWEKACSLGLPVSVYKPPFKAVPWDKASLIGHRSREIIVSELSRARVAETQVALQAELDALSERYIEAGRFSAPFVVAA